MLIALSEVWRWLALLAVLWAAEARPPREERLKITGRVTFDGHKLPADRKVFAQLSRDFPGAGGAADLTTKVDAAGRFTFDKVPEGNWWLLAWVDDDGDGKLTPGKEIMGYSTINPVPIGEGRSSFVAKVDLDPVLVTLVTRFEPVRGNMPARRVLETLRIIPLHPKTARFLDDAEVIVSAKKIQLAPEGGSFLFAPDPPEDVAGNYKVEVSHAAYGRAPKKRLIAPRAFGAVPDAKLVDKRVEWTQPPWANMAMVRASLANGTLLYDKAARSPLELPELAPGASVRVRVGRVDIQHAGDVTLQVGEVLLKVPPAPPGKAPAPPAPAPNPPAKAQAPSAPPAAVKH